MPSLLSSCDQASNISQALQVTKLPNLSHDGYQQPQTYVKPEAAITVFELLMMSGVSPETC
jgi:hypothetical protein